MSLMIHHHARANIAALIQPDNGYRGEMARKGKQLKNHMKENLKNIRATESKAREQRELASQPTKELYKLSQFREVEPRVYESSTNENRRPSMDGFLTKGISERRLEERIQDGREKRAQLEKSMEDARYVADKPPTPRKLSVPRSTDIAKLAPRNNANFIQKNRVKTLMMIPPRGDEKQEEVKRHDSFGRVPQYLEQRKSQWEEEKEEIRRRAPDPNCPPGMKLMPEEERLHTLEVLRTSQIEAMKQLQAMPFVIETPSLKRKQVMLEDKLREIENAMALFSRTKVFIARDS